MAGAGEDESALPPPPPPSPLDQKKPMEEAAAGKLTRLEHEHGAADAPSFRMEDLPVEVQPVIMSLLPLKEAARTSIVSTSWRMLWTFHSNLCFDGPSDPDSDTDDEFAGQDSTKMKRAKFIDTVNSVIQQHSGIGINKFSIRCGLHKEYSDHLDRWIGFAASSKAKMIHFNLKKTYLPFELGVTVSSILFVWVMFQLQKLPTRQQGMFLHLRHMTCQLIVHSNDPNADNGVLRLANCLDVAPGLETLHLHMLCAISSGFSSGEVVGMRRHGHLKTVFMSGFRCYKAQIELACCILRNASVLEQLIIEPRITDSVWADDCSEWNTDLSDILPGVCEWAQVTSERFGKAITVLGASLHTTEASLAQQDARSF